MERWLGKIAVVTGASSGIGAACSKDILAKGMIVVGLARRQERMEKELKSCLPKEQQDCFHALKCDVTKEEDILKSFEWIEENLGGVDVLVNNAGILPKKPIIAADNTEDLKAVLNTNVLAVALCTREAFCSMKKRGVDGHVITINSVAGHMIPYIPGSPMGIYPSTKHAITAMTEIFRQEFFENETKIKITSICPGIVETEIFGSTMPKDAPYLLSENISNAVVYCLQTPPDMQVISMTIKPMGEKF